MKRHVKVELLFLLQAILALCWGTSAVVKKALCIAESTFIHNHAISIVWYKSDIEEVTSFLRKFVGAVVLTENANTEKVREFNKIIGFKQTVFFATEVNEFANFMALLKPDTVVPIRVILVLIQPTTDAELAAITKTSWENDLADIIIVSTKEGENVELSTYFPYKKGTCGDTTPAKIKLDGKKWFPNKFTNFQGCPIKVTLLSLLPYLRLTIENETVTSVSGIDGRVFNILIEKLNATMDIVSWKDHGGIGAYINGTATGSFGDLVYRHADIFAPAIIISHLRYPMAQISNVFGTVDVYWFGPNRQEIHEWLKVLQPLMTEISPALITSFVLFIVVTKIVIRYGFHRENFRHSVMFQSFIMFLGQEVRFESKSALLNWLFVMWIWFCMIVRIVYQGDLVNGLQKPILEKPLMNFKEAIKVVDGYGGSELFREFYQGTTYYQKFNVFKIGDVTSQVKKVAYGKRFLIASDRLVAFELSNDLQIIDEPISHAPMCYFMRPGWPAAKEIDIVIQRLTEAGFMQKVLRDHIHKWMRKREVHHNNRKTRPLNMKALIGCFYVLGVLYFICVLVFIVKIVFYRLIFKPKQKNRYLKGKVLRVPIHELL